MSHTVLIASEFKASEFQFLRNAFTNLGWTVRENHRVRAYTPSEEIEYPFVAVNPDSFSGSYAYDIGMRLDTKTDRVQLFGDFFQGSIAKTLGEDLGVLKKEYALEIVRDQFPSAQITEAKTNAGGTDVVLEIWG